MTFNMASPSGHFRLTVDHFRHPPILRWSDRTCGWMIKNDRGDPRIHRDEARVNFHVRSQVTKGLVKWRCDRARRRQHLKKNRAVIIVFICRVVYNAGHRWYTKSNPRFWFRHCSCDGIRARWDIRPYGICERKGRRDTNENSTYVDE